MKVKDLILELERFDPEAKAWLEYDNGATSIATCVRQIREWEGRPVISDFKLKDGEDD